MGWGFGEEFTAKALRSGRVAKEDEIWVAGALDEEWLNAEYAENAEEDWEMGGWGLVERVYRKEFTAKALRSGRVAKEDGIWVAGALDEEGLNAECAENAEEDWEMGGWGLVERVYRRGAKVGKGRKGRWNLGCWGVGLGFCHIEHIEHKGEWEKMGGWIIWNF